MRRGNTWMKISGANRVSATDLPPYDDVKPMAHALIAAAPERIMWGTDWPHPNKYLVNPNDGDLVDAFGDWVTDEGDAPQDHGRHPRRLLPVLTILRLRALGFVQFACRIVRPSPPPEEQLFDGMRKIRPASFRASRDQIVQP